MSDIFISYASEDRERVEPLVKALEELGWSVFWDRQILAGEEYRNVIDEKILDAKCIVVLWSNTSVSKNWVIEEAEDGFDNDKLIPVFIDNGKLKAPRGLRQIHAVSLDRWDGEKDFPALRELVAAIKQKVEPSQRAAVEKIPAKYENVVERTDISKRGADIKQETGVSREITYLPYIKFIINWKKKSSVFGYQISDMIKEPVIHSYNQGLLEMLNVQADSFSGSDIPTSLIFDRLSLFMDKKDFQMLIEEQSLLFEKLIFRDSLGQRSVPIRFNDKHPFFPNMVYWPLLISKQIIGDDQGPHQMQLFTVFNPTMCESEQ